MYNYQTYKAQKSKIKKGDRAKQRFIQESITRQSRRDLLVEIS